MLQDFLQRLGGGVIIEIDGLAYEILGHAFELLFEKQRLANTCETNSTQATPANEAWTGCGPHYNNTTFWSAGRSCKFATETRRPKHPSDNPLDRECCHIQPKRQRQRYGMTWAVSQRGGGGARVVLERGGERGGGA